MFEELQRAGCEVVFLNHSFGDSPEERMLLQMQGVFAEYERALIKERTRRGRLFAARQGRVNWSHAPYGYRLILKTESAPQKLVIDETEAEVARQIFRWCVEERMTCYAIEKRLRQMGVPTRKGNAFGWRQSTVGNILRNTSYKGVVYCNRTKKVDAKRPIGDRGFKDLRPGNLRSHGERPKEEWIEVRVPAIVDPETWGSCPTTARKEPREGHSQQHQAPLPPEKPLDLRSLRKADDRGVDGNRQTVCVQGSLSQARALGLRRAQRDGLRHRATGVGIRQGAALRPESLEEPL